MTALLAIDQGTTGTTRLVWQDRRTAERCAALPRDLVRERTGLGAAALAGLGTGVCSGLDELRTLARPGARYEPTMAPDEVARRRADWRDAVRRATLRQGQPT